MSENSDGLPTSSAAPRNVRRIRLGLLTKLFVAFTLVMAGYAGLSSTYLLRHFYDDKARYVIFSLHQSAEASCSRLLSKKHSAAETSLLLRQSDSASGFAFEAKSGGVIAENRLNDASRNSTLRSSQLWTLITKRSEGGRLANFTSELKFQGQRIFVSACRVDSEGDSIWLLFAVDAAEALSPALELLVKMGVLFVGLLLAGFGVFYVLARSLTRPLVALATIADDLGAGNYRSNIVVRGSDELGVLADSFSILSQKLDARESELEKSTELANQDFLTGLWNRRYMDRRVQEHFALAKRHNHDLSLVYLDADHFKRVNDVHGHAAGDDVLKDFAKIMKQQLRDTDFVARVGGEEFVMVLPQTNLEGALLAATKLRNAIKAHVFLGELKVKLTASMGVMSIKENASFASAQDLIAATDKLAYQSKTSGRDRISSPRGQIA